MKISTKLWKTRKLSRNIEVLLSGDSTKIFRRFKNILVGRTLARMGFWKWLWG